MRANRIVSLVALVLAAAAMFLAAYLFTRLHDQQSTIQRSRGAVAITLCHAVNHDRTVLRSMIVAGAKSSKPFEPIYKQYGFPVYVVRLSQARIAASRLDDLQCSTLAKKIERAAR